MAEKKKTTAKKFLSLFKNIAFINNKKSLEKYKEKKKAEAEVMMATLKEMMRTPMRSSNDSIASMNGGEQEIYLYDFVQEWNNGGSFFRDGDNGNILLTPLQSGGAESRQDALVAVDSAIEKMEPKVVLKPIDVFHELERIPTPITLEHLEEKIAVLNMKKDFIRSNSYAKKEVIDMVTRLENRRKWNEFKDFFEKFDNTDTDKVNALINKYNLVLKTSDLFIPKFPKEAIDIMKEYKDNVKKLCGKCPVFYVIAEVEMFKKEDKRNDPILLVQSPFGIYWQILGAWDRELILLEEL
jgi:hypothetical protein